MANFSNEAESQLAKGVLTSAQNEGQETIVLRLSDDSPEDGIGGLFSERILIDGYTLKSCPCAVACVAEALLKTASSR